ncbi:MAG: DUF1428 domain-containing protein [Thermoleophilaceae bacterium]
MGQYVDGFVVPVPKGRVDDYKEMATKAAAMWREYGALEVKECLADDVPKGEVTSFPRSVQATDDEIVVFSWITYESRADRDRVNEKVMSDPRMKEMMDPEDPPMDPKRMFFGGFETIVDG